MTGNTRALVEHDPEARFVVNIHSIHNYKLIAAVVPRDLLVPFTGVDGEDINALRKKAARLVRGEKQCDNDDAAQPADDSDPLPFDRGGTKGLATAGPNTIFKGTLSTQNKLELTKMASVLGITVLEKDRKQELVSKVREYLEANPSVRNNVQFIQVTWRSNRKASTIVASTPETASSQSLLSPRFPSLSLRLHTGGVTDVPRGSVKHVRFSGEAAIQDLRERAEKILAIRESEELAEEAVRLGRMVSSDAPLY